MMATITLPAPTKRSVRFKRFSWNQAHDGSFPPIPKTAKPPIPPSIPQPPASDTTKPAAAGNNVQQETAKSDVSPTVLCEKPAHNAIAKQYGKKRKQPFVRPFWDDEAGHLPTSTNDDSEKDFEAMLNEMQSLKDGPPEPSSPAKTAKKRRAK